MTSGNVFEMLTAGAGQTAAASSATFRNRTERPSLTGIFATMLGTDATASSNTAASTNKSDAVTGSATTGEYERFQYRETEIGQAETQGLDEKLEGAEETLEEFGEQVVAMVADEFEVTEDEVLEALETLGLSTVDLIEPQNLVELALEITGGEEPSELLVNPGFMDLMEKVNTLSGQLLEALNISAEEVDDFIMYVDDEFLLDTLPDPDEELIYEDDDVDNLYGEDIEMMEVSEEDYVEDDLAENIVVEDDVVEDVAGEELEEEEWLDEEYETIVMEEESEPVEVEEAEETELPDEPVQTLNSSAEAEDTESEEEDEPMDSQPRQNSGFQVDTPMTGARMEVPDFGNVPLDAQMPDESYLSIDTMDIIQQIAEKVRVSLSENETSMELQLNPENLGKVYLQVTAKEGTVSAQISAVNEAVKNALEMQMIDLKESLNQAGVKVEAIEVTVASHEFEQNLEQDARRGEQEGERAEAVALHRRSIRRDALDQLVGLMTEEEALVARMMRENGNTMDMTV